MTTRLTKLFLHNCVEEQTQTKGKGANTKRRTNASIKVSSGSNKSRGSRRRRKANNHQFSVRYLDEARKEQAQSDRTQENLRKLIVPVTDKSKKLMAKVCEELSWRC